MLIALSELVFGGDTLAWVVVLCSVAVIAGEWTDSKAESEWQMGDLRINFATRQVWKGGKELTLRYKEFELLSLLVSRKGDVVTRAGWDDRFGHWRTCHSLPDALAEIGLSPRTDGGTPATVRSG